MERLAEPGVSKRRQNRKLDKFEMPTDPVAGNVRRKRRVREVGPVLAASSDITPAEAHDLGLHYGDRETKSVPARMTLEQICAPHVEIVEVAEHGVVTRPDLAGEYRRVNGRNQLNLWG